MQKEKLTLPGTGKAITITAEVVTKAIKELMTREKENRFINPQMSIEDFARAYYGNKFFEEHLKPLLTKIEK